MPWVVSSQTTPSSGVSNSLLWMKFSQAKIMAASVASASTTAPRLTRRFCFINGPGRATPRQKILGANQCPFLGSVYLQKLPYISITYRIERLGISRKSAFWKDPYSFLKPKLPLKLQAQAAPERAESGHQRHTTVLGVQGNVTLSEEVVALRVGLPAARPEFGQPLVHAHMEIGLHVKKGFAKAIHASECCTADPLVACRDPRAEARHLSGNFGSDRVAACGAEKLAEGAGRRARRSQSAGKSIKGGKFDVISQLFPVHCTRAPTTRRAAVIRETVRIDVLEKVSDRKIRSPAEDGDVGVVLVKGRNLQFATRTQLPFGCHLFVETAFKHRTSCPPHEYGKGIQFVHGSRQGVCSFSVKRLEWLGAGWHGSKNQGPVPIVGEARVKLQAWTQRTSRAAQTDQDIFAAIFKDSAVPKNQGAALIDAHAAKCGAHISQLRFAQHQRGVRPGAKRSGGQPNRGDTASGRLAVITYQASKQQPTGRTQLLIVSKCSCRASGETGNRTGPAGAIGKL